MTTNKAGWEPLSLMLDSGGSGFASTFKLTTTDAEGNEKDFFVKTGSGQDAEVMFRGELPQSSRV